MKELKYRFTVIVLALLGSVYALWPRDTVVRVQAPDGEGFVYDTVKKVPIRLGLDLRGGMHIALEPDESQGVITDISDQMQRALTVVRNRIDALGVAETNVQLEGERRIIVELPGIDDPLRAQEIVETTARLVFRIVDKTNELERALPAIDRALRTRGVGGASPGRPAPKAGVDILTGGAVEDTTSAPADGLLSGMILPGDIPGGYRVRADQYRLAEQWLAYPEVRAALRPGKEAVWGSDSVQVGNVWYRSLYVLDTRTILEGTDLIDARAQQDPMSGTVVLFELNNAGGRNFRRYTQAHVNDYMAIVLDNRVMGPPPVIQSAIGTRGQITMYGKPLRAAEDLALVLRAGALPIALKIEEVRAVGASLGQDAIDQGLRAGLLGLGMVILIMVVYYRFSGMLAVIGLAFYSITTLAVLASLGAVLTLPGIAGFVLSIGMAVDANFLIFERIREELVRGKTIRTSIDEGFNHAWSAIVDTHVTTALTALILFQFGTGPVRGFAVALLAGIASSLVSAIFVVRSLFLLWLTRSRNAQTLSI